MPYYYSQDDSQCEVDFLVQLGMDVCPLEVKAEENVRSQSLKSYRTKFEPIRAFRASMKDYEVQDQPLAGGRICRFVNFPLVGAREWLFHSGDWKGLARLIEKEMRGELPPCSIGEWTAKSAARRLMEV